ncbi:hypothetical protein, partial [Parapedobacter defluvii]|uniref:hypothetical protein n=1 Tax=Parapedobacter defluvii TaxID=2045106 RepID=UPI00333E3119
MKYDAHLVHLDTLVQVNRLIQVGSSVTSGFPCGEVSTKMKPFATLIPFFVEQASLKTSLAHPIQQKNPTYVGLHFGCGEGGIRTRDTLNTYTHFPGVLIRPL